MTVTVAPDGASVENGGPARHRRPKGKVEHLTADEQHTAGRAARRDVPRASHSVWEPPAGRLDPVSLLEQQAASRVPDLVPIRNGRMASSPFAFYRGAAAVMASDLA